MTANSKEWIQYLMASEDGSTGAKDDINWD